MNLAQVDLNLLVILKHLLEEKAHVSQHGIGTRYESANGGDRSLQKLRTVLVFNDDLLVRAAYGCELTPKRKRLNKILILYLRA